MVRFPNRHNDMRRFQRTRRTSRTARSANAFHIQTGQQRNAVRAAHDKGNRVGQTIGCAELTSSTAINFFNRSASSLADKRLQLRTVKNRRFHKFFQRFDQTDDAGQIFRAGAALIFMSAAKQNRVRMQRRLDVKQAGAFRPVKFVRADGNQIGVELADACSNGSLPNHCTASV